MNNAAAWRRDFADGCIACVPTVLGYLGIGFSAGALARVSGMSVGEVTLMSLILYAGSAQFVVAGMIQNNAAVVAVWISVFFINLRHLLLSAYMAPRFKNMGALKNVVLGAQLTDETFGVASVARRELSFAWMLGLNLTAYLNWLLGNVVGAVSVHLLPAGVLQNLQFALVAMFVGLIVMHIAATKKRAPQIWAAAATVVLFYPVSLFISREFGVIIVAVVVSFIAMWLSLWKSD